MLIGERSIVDHPSQEGEAAKDDTEEETRGNYFDHSTRTRSSIIRFERCFKLTRMNQATSFIDLSAQSRLKKNLGQRRFNDTTREECLPGYGTNNIFREAQLILSFGSEFELSVIHSRSTRSARSK